MINIIGAELLVQVVPQGIMSVNGSDVNMGCTSPPVDSGGVMVCNFSDCYTSYLLNGNSPDINTSTSNWASKLVTVKKNDGTHDIPFDHVVLTFGFDTAVSLALIELDMLLCPEWNIGAPHTSLYGDENARLVFSSSDFIANYYPLQSQQTSCDSLSTLSIPVEEMIAYTFWHIIVSFATQQEIEWVHVGEVRFLGRDKLKARASICTTEEFFVSKNFICCGNRRHSFVDYVSFFKDPTSNTLSSSSASSSDVTSTTILTIESTFGECE